MKTKIIVMLVSSVLLLTTNSFFSQVALHENGTNYARLISSNTNTTSNATDVASNLKKVTASIKSY